MGTSTHETADVAIQPSMPVVGSRSDILGFITTKIRAAAAAPGAPHLREHVMTRVG